MPGKMPPIGASIASGNRMSKLNAADAKAVSRTAHLPPMKLAGKPAGKPAPKRAYKHGGPVKRKYADGGPVSATMDVTREQAALYERQAAENARLRGAAAAKQSASAPSSAPMPRVTGAPDVAPRGAPRPPPASGGLALGDRALELMRGHNAREAANAVAASRQAGPPMRAVNPDAVDRFLAAIQARGGKQQMGNDMTARLAAVRNASRLTQSPATMLRMKKGGPVKGKK